MDYSKSKERIKRQLERDWNKLYKLSAKIGDIKCNDLDVRFGTALGLGALVWVGCMFLQPTLLNAGMPLELLQPLSVAVPLAAGVAAEEGMIKAFKNKQRLKKISKAKTQQERIEDATRLEIAKERLFGKIKVLESTYAELETKEKLAKEAPLSATKPSADPRSLEEINKSINGLEDVIYEKMANLDATAAKKVLKKNFWRERDKNQKTIDLPLSIILGFVAGIAIYNMPGIIASFQGVATSGSLFQFLLPGYIAAAGSVGYYLKRNKDYTNAFKTVNKEVLGDDALPETVNDSEYNRKLADNKVERFDLQLRDQIKEVASIASVEEEERTIKQVKFNTSDDILFEDFEPVKITEATRQHVIEHPELYRNCPARVRQGLFYTDEEYEARFEEVLSKPLPGSEEKGISYVKKNKR